MVIFIVCYFNVHEYVKQVLLDWDWRCLHSDDSSVASRFPYLIPASSDSDRSSRCVMVIWESIVCA